jgi:hypothetical protein
MLSNDGSFDRFIIIAAISQHDHVARVRGTDILFQVSRADVLHDPLMLGVIVQMMLQAIPLAIVRDGRQWDQDVMDDQDDIGPRMSDDKTLAMIARFGVFRMPTGALLERALNQERNVPGQAWQGLERFRHPLGLRLGELLQRRDRDAGMGLQKLTEL